MSNAPIEILPSNPTGYAPNPTGYAPNPTGYAPNPTGYAPNPTGYAPNPTEYNPKWQIYLDTHQIRLDTPPTPTKGLNRRHSGFTGVQAASWKTYATISTNSTKPQPNQNRKIATSPHEDKERYVEQYMIYYAVV